MAGGIKRLEIAPRREGGDGWWKYSPTLNHTSKQESTEADDLSGDEHIEQRAVDMATHADDQNGEIQVASWEVRQCGRCLLYADILTHTHTHRRGDRAVKAV